MQRFLAANRARLAGSDYAALYAWSVESPGEFWEAVWTFCGVSAATSYTTAVRDLHRMPGARWFEGATLNFAANLLAPQRTGAAIVFANERDERVELTWQELRAHVASVAASLESLGVGKGDRVAGFIANRPEAIVAMLATASVGAVWSSCSPDFGVDAVLDRFGQIEPKVLFATDGYFYNGKSIDSLPALRSIAARLPTLRAVVVVPYRRPRTGHERDPGRDAVPAAAPAARRAHVHARRIRRSAVHSVLVRHHRRAEVHRARRRRHAAAAPQGARAAHRHLARRRRVLLHDDGLDDVELARVGARFRRDTRAVRRRAAASGPRRAVAARGTRAHQRVRHEREVI